MHYEIPQLSSRYYLFSLATTYWENVTQMNANINNDKTFFQELGMQHISILRFKYNTSGIIPKLRYALFTTILPPTYLWLHFLDYFTNQLPK